MRGQNRSIYDPLSEFVIDAIIDAKYLADCQGLPQDGRILEISPQDWESILRDHCHILWDANSFLGMEIRVTYTEDRPRVTHGQTHTAV